MQIHNSTEQWSLKKRLGFEITMMMAGTFDAWGLAGDLAFTEALMRSAKRAAEGIAEKMATSIGQHAGELNSQAWKRMAVEATRDAFIEVSPKYPMVNLGRNSSFAGVVADCTARVVAPAGSKWALAVESRIDQSTRAQLKSFGIPSAQIEKTIKEGHALRHACKN